MIDTVFSLDDFKKIMRREGGLKQDIRICARYESAGEFSVKCQVIVSAGLFSMVTGKLRKILRCIVSERMFNYVFITSPYENKEKERYKEWLKESYEKVENSLGFKPIEGIWTVETTP